MRFLRSLFHVPIISKAFRPFNFLWPSRILAACSKMATSFISKAPSVKSAIPPSGPIQQNETDKMLKPNKLSIINDQNNKDSDETARRRRNRPNSKTRRANRARLEAIIHPEGQSLLTLTRHSRVRQVFFSPKGRKVPTQSPRKSAIRPIDQSQRLTPPPPTYFMPQAATIHPNPLSFSPSISSATPPPTSVTPQAAPIHPNPILLSPSISSALPPPILVRPQAASLHPNPILLSPSMSSATPPSILVRPQTAPIYPNPISLSPPMSSATPPSILVRPLAASLHPNPISSNPSMSSATPASEAQPLQSLQPCKPDPKTPRPSTEYLTIASLIPTRTLNPQPLLIILDLNGTLLFREVGSTKYISRPFLMNFLNYCLENHFILIWSSAKPHNVKAICNKLFTPEQHQKLYGIWARDTFGLTPEEYKEKTQVYKNLDSIWASPIIARKHPWYRKYGVEWSQKNTLLVDDSIEKAKYQPYNHIKISEFVKNSNEATLPKDKSFLGQVTAYLEEASLYDNVSAFVHQTQFQVDQQWSWDWGEEMQGLRNEGGKQEVRTAEEKQELRNEKGVVKHGYNNVVGGTSTGEIKKEPEDETDGPVPLSDEEENEGPIPLSDDDEGGGVKLPSDEGLHLPTGP